MAIALLGIKPNSSVYLIYQLSYYWKLKAIESMETSSTAIPNEERTQLINALIDNHQIKDILMKSVPVSSIKNKSMIQESAPVIAQTQV
jgi:hypothetical protein